MVLLDTVTDPEARQWSAARAVEYGWSRAVLIDHIATNRHAQVSAAPNNFPATLAGGESDLAREIVQDPYDLDFLALDPGYTERELEDALVARMTHFFTELGDGFAFVGRQYRLPVGEQEFFIDLLFFHLGLRRFIRTNGVPVATAVDPTIGVPAQALSGSALVRSAPSANACAASIAARGRRSSGRSRSKIANAGRTHATA